jgi:hypothetical protein
MSPPSSGLKSKPYKKSVRSRQQARLKIEIFINTAVRTANPTIPYLLFKSYCNIRRSIVRDRLLMAP